jgi:hypothetical protein
MLAARPLVVVELVLVGLAFTALVAVAGLGRALVTEGGIG